MGFNYLTNVPLEQAKKDWVDALDGETYPNPLPKDVKPAIW